MVSKMRRFFASKHRCRCRLIVIVVVVAVVVVVVVIVVVVVVVDRSRQKTGSQIGRRKQKKVSPDSLFATSLASIPGANATCHVLGSFTSLSCTDTF